jgi:hypothetical protein
VEEFSAPLLTVKCIRPLQAANARIAQVVYALMQQEGMRR